MKKQEAKNEVISLISKFLKYLEIVKGRSSSTLKEYQRKLLKFFSWNNYLHPQRITKETIWQFRIYLSDQKLDKKTQSYYLIALRNFLKFLKNEGLNVLDPTLIELPKTTRKEIEILNEQELQKLLNSLDIYSSNLKNLRDRAIIECLFSTGLRVSELCNLNRDIDLEKREIIVKGKGGQIRLVFLSKKASQILKKYLQQRKDNFTPLFISLAKNSWGKRLTPRAIQKIIKNKARMVGLIKNIHPHSFRHQLATTLISKGVDIRIVQELLGHKNISTTQIYTHIAKPKLKKIFEKYIR
ncbi:MAG: tyrosine-type recombinase/integrase [Patescibacteria group bacterium]|nr:tyrosine-type recombinase/integrase [Patescibacteria group bacterium]